MDKTPAKPQIVSARKEALITVIQDVQYAVLDGTFCVFKQTTLSRQESGAETSFENCKPNWSIQGFAELKSIERFLEGGSSSIGKLGDLTYQPPHILQMARERGFVAAAQASEQASELVFDLFEKDELDRAGITRWDVRSHMLFDRFGEVLPTGVLFDYMHGNLRDGAYDLEKVVKLLSGREGVINSWQDWGSTSHLIPGRRGVTQLAGEKLAIEAVPHYNSEYGCRAGVSFIFQPTLEEMRAMWAKMKELNKDFPSTAGHHAIFELDLLGLRKGGAAKYENYWETDSSSCSGDGKED